MMGGRIISPLALLASILNGRLFVVAGSAGDHFAHNLFVDLAP